MTRFLFFIFFALTLPLMKAQQALPKGVSFFGQAAYNRPMDYQSYSESGSNNQSINYYFRNAFSASIGLTNLKKRISFSPALRYSYTSGTISNYWSRDYGNMTTTGRFSLSKLTNEFIWYGRIGKNKNLRLGGGVFLGRSVTKNIHVTQVFKSNDTLYKGGSYTYSNNYFSEWQSGMLVDVKYTFRSPSLKRRCISVGARAMVSTGIFPYAVTYFKKSFNELECYVTYNFWRPRLDSAGLAKARERFIPKGYSFFAQGGYNRPVDYQNRGMDFQKSKALFKNSASAGAGINYSERKWIRSGILKFTYVEGRTSASQTFKTGGTRLTADFFIGKISEEFLIHKITGRNKLFIGAGLFFSQNVYARYAGTVTSSGYSNNYPFYHTTSRKITSSDFATKSGGLLLDIKYSFKSHATTTSCFIMGGRILTGTGLPYATGPLGGRLLAYQEVEVYLSYNFWQKRKSQEPKPAEEPKEPVNWKGQYNNN